MLGWGWRETSILLEFGCIHRVWFSQWSMKVLCIYHENVILRSAYAPLILTPHCPPWMKHLWFNKWNEEYDRTSTLCCIKPLKMFIGKLSLFSETRSCYVVQAALHLQSSCLRSAGIRGRCNPTQLHWSLEDVNYSSIICLILIAVIT